MVSRMTPLFRRPGYQLSPVKPHLPARFVRRDMHIAHPSRAFDPGMLVQNRFLLDRGKCCMLLYKALMAEHREPRWIYHLV